ncbi:MAG: leucine-rich repeat domain-containing protein [Firmicutes bacterium]|nr:leucine-rich repeat domain-containing protein [Bacillota bacterium]
MERSPAFRHRIILTVLPALVLLLLLLPMTASAEEAPVSGQCGESLTWELDLASGTLTIRGSGDMTDYGDPNKDDGLETAPWTVNGYQSDITEIVVEPGVTSIGNYAFKTIYFIREVKLPEGLTRIGEHAFFSNGQLSQITIPESVTQIGRAAFFGCNQLQSITLPAGMTEIYSQVFSSCDCLTEIVIPDGVTTIGSFSFANCNNLARVAIPSSVSEIGWYAFDHCDSLSDVQYGGTPEQWNQIKIGDNNEDLTRAWKNAGVSDPRIDSKTDRKPESHPVPIPDRNKIKTRAAESFQHVAKILLPAAGILAVLAVCAFLAALFYSKKKQGSTANIAGNSVNPMTQTGQPEAAGWIPAPHPEGSPVSGQPLSDRQCGDHLFWSFDESSGRLTVSGTGKMYDYFSISDIPWIKLKIRSLLLESGVTGIGNNAFADRAELSEVILPDSLVSIGEDAFLFCKKIEQLILPDSLQTIHSSAFRRCTGLAEVTIPPGVTYLDESIFEGCIGLTTVTIPASTTLIHKYAFRSCSRITRVYYEGTAEQWAKLMESQDENSALRSAAVHHSIQMR